MQYNQDFLVDEGCNVRLRMISCGYTSLNHDAFVDIPAAEDLPSWHGPRSERSELTELRAGATGMSREREILTRIVGSISTQFNVVPHPKLCTSAHHHHISPHRRRSLIPKHLLFTIVRPHAIRLGPWIARTHPPRSTLQSSAIMTSRVGLPDIYLSTTVMTPSNASNL